MKKLHRERIVLFSASESRRRDPDHSSDRVLRIGTHDHLRRVHLRLQRIAHGKTLKQQQLGIIRY